MLTVDAARAAMLAAASALPAETVPLSGALGRTLTAPVTASRDQPPFAASAMDGYAVRRDDLGAASVRGLRVVGESAAGAGYPAPLGALEAVRIFTGAPLPEGADCVVIQEEVSRHGDLMRWGGKQASDFVRPLGIDFRAGATLLRAGERLDGIALALAAAAGLGELSVARRPRVALLATGDEIVEPGAEPRSNQVFDSVSHGLAGLIERWGGEPVRLRPLRDDLKLIAQAAEAALKTTDLLVCIGGASVGDHDLVKPALDTLGLERLVERVALRPGKPTWFGRTPAGLALGLPGNPASALVCAHLFLAPLLAALQGRDPASETSTVRARLATALPANGPREHYLRTRLDVDGDAVLTADPFEQQDSSLLSIFAGANALLRRPVDDGPRQPGDLVDVLRLQRP
jgi:molybdopterin molybdotransferase